MNDMKQWNKHVKSVLALAAAALVSACGPSVGDLEISAAYVDGNKMEDADTLKLTPGRSSYLKFDILNEGDNEVTINAIGFDNVSSVLGIKDAEIGIVSGGSPLAAGASFTIGGPTVEVPGDAGGHEESESIELLINITGESDGETVTEDVKIKVGAVISGGASGGASQDL